ncbi:MAG TPA: SirB2 family protein [Burkholderiales bacterium]|nr:SirB2 family protein [Burkholderiales bacterium]
MYIVLKQIHLAAAIGSLSLFVLRGLLMLADSPALRGKTLRILPHVVDTLLLLAGVGLAYLLRQVPGVSLWFTAKLVALLLYIVLGSVALKRGRSKGTRAFAFVAALAVFAYIVGVAIHKNPWSWFSA